jgi:ribonucleotide reductase alpha subunit
VKIVKRQKEKSNMNDILPYRHICLERPIKRGIRICNWLITKTVDGKWWNVLDPSRKSYVKLTSLSQALNVVRTLHRTK